MPDNAEDLSKLLDVQPHAVVSRVLLKKKTGNVTLFAFDQGEELSRHTSPFEALIIGVEGEGEVDVGDQTFVVHEGDLVTLPANVEHGVRAVGTFKMMLVMIRE